MILGITGGTGCGKTTLLRLVEERGGLVLDCDRIYHSLLETDRELLRAIEAAFPGVVEEGVLQRKKLGAAVFSDKAALQRLNAITHGAVKQEVARRLRSAPSHSAIDAIALFESGLSDLCHTTVAVVAPTEARLRRLMARDGISREYALARLQAQPGEDWFRQRADHVLQNDGTIDAFATICLAFLDEIGIMKEINIAKESSL